MSLQSLYVCVLYCIVLSIVCLLHCALTDIIVPCALYSKHIHKPQISLCPEVLVIQHKFFFFHFPTPSLFFLSICFCWRMQTQKNKSVFCFVFWVFFCFFFPPPLCWCFKHQHYSDWVVHYENSLEQNAHMHTFENIWMLSFYPTYFILKTFHI